MNLRNKLAFFIALNNYVELITRGTSPLSLSDAIANSLQYVKAFGGTEQNGTPTPDTPVDIVSNNGVLKVRHQSGLPLGYTLLEYIGTASGSYIDTGITPTINAKADVKFAPTQTSTTWYWGARSDPNRFCCATFSSGTNFGIGMTNNTWPANRIPVTLESIYDCVVANGYASVNGAEYTETPVESFGNAGTFYLGKTVAAAKYYKCKLWENNVLVFDGIPAKNANDVIGMYDLVSEQFFTNQGTGDFVAGNPVSDPVEIYTDGTVETVNVHGKNLFDKNNANILSAFISGSGNVSASGIDRLIYLQVEAGKTYYVSFTGNGGGRIAFFDNVPSIGSQGVSVRNFYRGGAITVPTGMSYFGFHFNTNSIPLNDMLNTLQLELGSTATDYAPYYDGGTATAEMLLKVGNYQDEQEILSGIVTRKVGVKVFNGTENFSVIRNTFRYSLIGLLMDTKMICSHFDGDVSPSVPTLNQPDLTVKNNASDNNKAYFKYAAKTTVESFQQWLADQYNAGTPVIVVYPLATPTTESVAGQTLQVTAGDNVLEITQASLTGLELEAKYKKRK